MNVRTRHDASVGWLDPSGVPSADPEVVAHGIPGISPASLLVRVEAVESGCETSCLVWGTVTARPILFRVDGQAAREMLAALAAGERPVAIVEPDQVVCEELD